MKIANTERDQQKKLKTSDVSTTEECGVHIINGPPMNFDCNVLSDKHNFLWRRESHFSFSFQSADATTWCGFPIVRDDAASHAFHSLLVLHWKNRFGFERDGFDALKLHGTFCH